MLDGRFDAEGSSDFGPSHRALVAEEAFGGSISMDRDLSPVGYAIRVPEVPIGALCPRCDTCFWASGPTGYENERAICDACLLEACHPLGMLLALALVTRQLANLSAQEGDDYDGALQEVGLFAQVYEQVAAQDGPPRKFELPQLYRDVQDVPD